MNITQTYPTLAKQLKCPIFRLNLILLVLLPLFACDSSNDDSAPTDTSPPRSIEVTPTAAIQTESKQVFLPESVLVSNLTGITNAALVFSNINESVQTFSDLTQRELSGLVFEQEKDSNQDLQLRLEKILADILQENKFSTTNIATALSEQEHINGQYILNSLEAISPTLLTNELLTLTYQDPNLNPSDLPAALANESLYQKFRMQIGISTDESNTDFIVITLVPEALISNYQQLVANIQTPENITVLDENLANTTRAFIAQEISVSNADFLFIIDNSGSMSDEQEAISLAAQQFSDEISASSLDFQLATITTDDDTLRGNGFTNNLEQFKIDVKPGISGSGRETGIYYSEQALQSQASGDTIDGTVTLANFPRPGASLSIVIMSDEPSQYTRISPNSFDPNNNLFINRNYVVHGILNPADQLSSQYDDLAFATGGSVADISSPDTFPLIMVEIANKAGGGSTPYILDHKAIAATILVQINGVEIPNGKEGWQYFSSNQSLVIRGASTPTPGDSIEVSYSYASN